jgi:GMP synthase (glutamine-hydrolysing)
VFFYFHQDEVFDLPAALPVLASTDQCPVQAVRFGSDPIFGVQFHPEFNDLQAEEILAAATMRDLGPTVRVRRDLNDSTKSIQNRNLIVNFLRMNRNQ